MMKKPPSLSAVFGRTCPHCLVVIDPVCYGWHVRKCPSKKLTSIPNQDMSPKTPIKKEVAGNGHFVVDSPSRVCAPALSKDFQIGEDMVIGRLPLSGDSAVQTLYSSKDELNNLRGENQALKNDLKIKFEENEALKAKLNDLEVKLAEKADKVKSLELKLVGLELQLKLSEEAKRKALYLVGASRDGEKDLQVNCEAVCGQLTQPSNMTALGLVNCSGADPGGSNNHVYDKELETVNFVKKGIVATDSAKSDDFNMRLDLDRIVDLACGEGAMPFKFLSHVEGAIEDKEAVPSTLSTSRKQISRVSCNPENEDEDMATAGKSENLHTTEFNIPNSQNEFSPRDPYLTPHTSEPFQNVVYTNFPWMSPAPRDALVNQCFREDFKNMGCEDGHGGVKVSRDFSGTTGGCLTDVVADGLAPEMQNHSVDTSFHVEKQKRGPFSHLPLEGESDLNVKQNARSHSSSATTESEINAVKAKSGFRRMVLQSDSESDSGNNQDIHSRNNTCQTHLCDSKTNALRPVRLDLKNEKSERFCEGFRVEKTCTSGKASEPHLRRSKRLNVVCISDLSNDVICKEESEHSNNRSSEAPRISNIDSVSVSGDGVPDGEHAGVRRSKRLKKMYVQNPKESLHNESMHAEKFKSSDNESSASLEGSEVFKSGTSARIQSEACKAQVKRKLPIRTRKRLFADLESRPLYDNKYSLDSEEDDNEIESGADSLKGFITDSEGRQSSGYSTEHHSSSSSYSSDEVYRDPRHKRDIKIKNYVWELEGEMLSILAIDPKLCLRAVCALNRRQTEDEQKEKISKYTNNRGFDKLHAARGSRLAEFLTDGDICGPVKKSLEDLDKFDAGGLKFCQMLASKHSKQLFEMYTNAEDPHFPFA